MLPRHPIERVYRLLLLVGPSNLPSRLRGAGAEILHHESISLALILSAGRDRR